MNSDEFNDLEKFGKVIEKPPEQDSVKIKKKVKKNQDINFKTAFKKIFNKIFCFIRKNLVKTKKAFVKIKTIIKEKKEIRKRYKLALKRNRKSNDIHYKIVETKKQKRNKTIIVRRRVPDYYDTSILSSKKGHLASIYYLSLEGQSKNENAQVKHDSYTILKKSVWDFPIEDKSIFRRTFNTLKIQRLFKK